MIILGIILLIIGFIAKIAICGPSGSSSWSSASSCCCSARSATPWAGAAITTNSAACPPRRTARRGRVPAADGCAGPGARTAAPHTAPATPRVAGAVVYFHSRGPVLRAAQLAGRLAGLRVPVRGYRPGGTVSGCQPAGPRRRSRRPAGPRPAVPAGRRSRTGRGRTTAAGGGRAAGPWPGRWPPRPPRSTPSPGPGPALGCPRPGGRAGRPPGARHRGVPGAARAGGRGATGRRAGWCWGRGAVQPGDGAQHRVLHPGQRRMLQLAQPRVLVVAARPDPDRGPQIVQLDAALPGPRPEVFQ